MGHKKEREKKKEGGGKIAISGPVQRGKDKEESFFFGGCSSV